jgi:hypothetical protein
MDRKVLARPAGLEPATLGLEGRCSIHLSYGRVVENDRKTARAGRPEYCNGSSVRKRRHTCHLSSRAPYTQDPYAFLGAPKQVNVACYLAGGTAFGPFVSRDLTPSENNKPAGLTFE